MKFIYMVLVNCKRYFKDYKMLTLMFLLPIVVIFFTNTLSNSNFSNKSPKGEALNLNAAVVNLDKGELGYELIEKINPKSIYGDKEEALKALKNYDVLAVYEIGEDFTREINENIKPIINSYKLEEGNNLKILELQIEDKINDMLKINILKKNNIINEENDLNKTLVKVEYNTEKEILSTDNFLPIMMTMFFLIAFSSVISTDLFTLKREKILERFLSTSNRGYKIMGSIYVSMMLTQIIMYTSAFMVLKFLLKFHFDNFGIIILNIALMSMISVSLSIMLNRIIKEVASANLVLNLISIVMFFFYLGGMIAENSTKVPKIVAVLSKFTPFYWSLESIEKGVLFPNAFILILMALVLFSAGSIRYSNFAKE